MRFRFSLQCVRDFVLLCLVVCHFASDLLCLFVFNLLLIFCASDGHTALHGAARFGHMRVCQLLVDAKADVDAKDGCAFVFKTFQ